MAARDARQESKRPEGDPADADPSQAGHQPGVPGPVRRGGLVLKLYSHSLSLALFLLFVLGIFLRERGSPESKPVAAPHHMTGTG